MFQMIASPKTTKFAFQRNNMKTLRMFAVGMMFTALFAVSAFAQTGATPAAGAGKVGLINTFAFDDEKAGIAKYRTALNTLDVEFKAVNDELAALGGKLQALGKEIENLRKPGGAPVKPETINAKVEEYQLLETQIKRKQEDAKAQYNKRYQVVVGPIYGDILKALTDFAKQKGYAVILDGAKLEESGILMGFDEKYNITAEFITFYNARPAGAAAATTPK